MAWHWPVARLLSGISLNSCGSESNITQVHDWIIVWSNKYKTVMYMYYLVHVIFSSIGCHASYEKWNCFNSVSLSLTSTNPLYSHRPRQSETCKSSSSASAFPDDPAFCCACAPTPRVTSHRRKFEHLLCRRRPLQRTNRKGMQRATNTEQTATSNHLRE